MSQPSPERPFSLKSKEAAEQFALFMQGDRKARAQFPVAAQPHLVEMARAHGRGLPFDIVTEIVSQTWVHVLTGSAADFDPKRGNAGSYLRSLMLNAVKEIRASYAKPGKRTRDRSTRQQRKLQVRLEVTAAPTERPVEVDENEHATALNVADETATAERLDAHLDSETVLLDLAPAPVARALFLVHVQDETWQSAAKAVGMSRHQLARRFEVLRTRLAEEHAAVAA